MPSLTISLNLTAGQVLAYYHGQAQVVQAIATTGQRVQFPANALRRVVTQDGVHGWFRIEFDANHKFVALVPVDGD
ncbi:DUF2835 domain-containing protein [Opitutus sp. ER46]|uniref:DUF2835 domain-containing protein n=1 Tax=Opitutus sp. ER46 TaxID=2161864 RepID=UPI000D31F553|nr:DUF2835 domain-containing protein [Opitutus sp. ER46]PTY00544.1 DUF2835 domain-containing protein [Opitutus sp. ER46]